MNNYLFTHKKIEAGYEISMVLVVNGMRTAVVDKDVSSDYDGVVTAKRDMLRRVDVLDRKMGAATS